MRDLFDSVAEAEAFTFAENFTFPPNVTAEPLDRQHACLSLLYQTIGSSRVRVWDVMLLVPNVLFFAFLTYKCFDAVTRLGRSSSPIFAVIFTLVFVADVISIIRCVVSMALNMIATVNVTDRIIWLVLKFFLLATELSVLVFCLLFGHLDRANSVRWVVFVTFTVSLLYSGCQGILEFRDTNSTFHGNTFTLFGHGGMVFWFVSSTVLFLIYGVLCILPLTSLRRQLPLPAKRSFYVYCLSLACLNATQAVGSILLYSDIIEATCVVDVTTYLYFIGFAPFVYLIFLRSFFIPRQPAPSFSYIQQTDDEDDRSSARGPPPYVYCGDGDEGTMVDDLYNSSYDSTHFGRSPSPLPSRPRPEILSHQSGAEPELYVNRDWYTVGLAGSRSQLSINSDEGEVLEEGLKGLVR